MAGRWSAVGQPIGRPIKVKVVVVVPTLQYSVVDCRPPAWPSPLAVGRPIGRPIKVKVVVVVVPTLQYSAVGCRPPAWPSPPGGGGRRYGRKKKYIYIRKEPNSMRGVEGDSKN